MCSCSRTPALLGDFLFENETVERLPLDDDDAIGADPAKGVAGLNDVRNDNDRRGFPAQREVWESVVVVPRWSNRTLNSIELHPISLGFGKPRTFRGRPRLADEELGRKIIVFRFLVEILRCQTGRKLARTNRARTRSNSLMFSGKSS